MNLVDLNIKEIPQQTDATLVSHTKKEDIQKIKKACKDFESVFIYQLLKTMRQTIPKTSGMGSLSGKDTYNMLMDQKVAEELSSKGNGVGLQKVLFEQLTKSYPREIVERKIK